MKAILQTKQLGTSVQNYDYLLPKKHTQKCNFEVVYDIYIFDTNLP